MRLICYGECRTAIDSATVALVMKEDSRNNAFGGVAIRASPAWGVYISVSSLSGGAGV
jgi:hypothetical protein